MFQSSLIHSQVGIVNGVSVANILFMAAFAHFLGAHDSLGLYVGIPCALMNVLLIIASVVIRKRFLSAAVKAQYVISFLSFLTSFPVPSGVTFSSAAFIRGQHILLVTTLYIFFTVYFQWSTVLTILVLLFFGICYSVNHGYEQSFFAVATEVRLYDTINMPA